MANTCVKFWEDSTDSFCRKKKSYYCAYLKKLSVLMLESVPQQASNYACLVPRCPSRSLIANTEANHKQPRTMHGVKLLFLYFV